MKKIVLPAAVLLLCAVLTAPAWAEEKATKDECITMAKAAAEMLLKDGPETTFARISDPKGPFVWKDSYVLCMNISGGVVKAHPYKPGLVGRPLKSMKDINGVMFVMEFINKAKQEEGGWVQYMWPKPGEKKPSRKNAYAYRVQGTDFFMIAGVYE